MSSSEQHTDKPRLRRVVRPPAEEDAALPAADESERHGWGPDPNDGRRDRDWYQQQRPPHHE